MTVARMLAARLYGPGLPLRLEAVPIPTPGVGEALLRVRAAGVCHTELHMLDGVLNLGVVPLTPGHEVVGEVVAASGAGGPAVGQRVILYYYAPCGTCSYCRTGRDNLCPNVARQFGFTADGGYAEYMVAPFRCLLPVPEGLSDEAAVGLACGGATALHAARAVAGVQAGETVVLYGVGGVGLFLLQLCRLAGATVIAISRTPEKLALAADLGADLCVNGHDADPLESVYAHTAGNGADVVFDLVASAETMALATRMLARRGRLIFAGYSGARFSVSPLWLVLRELQVRGAVGNTVVELRETLDLAAGGQLRSINGPSYPLEEINQALADLRAGKIIGRATLRPHPLPPLLGGEGPRLERSVAFVLEREVLGRTRAPAGPTTEPAVAIVTKTPEKAGFSTIRHTASIASPLRPGEGVGGEVRPFTTELLQLIAQGADGPLATDDAAFNALALALFRYQYERNEPYRRFCDYRRQTPARVEHWRQIPAVPIGAFKEATLATEPVEQAVACFMSSGTTRPEQRSRHYHPDLTVYDVSARTNFAAHVLPDGARLPLLVLNPPPVALPNSSLAHYLGLMVDAYGAAGSGYFVDEGGLQQGRLLAALAEFVGQGRPVCLAGTTFAFVHLLDQMAEQGQRLALPPGSRVMDTGGVKGRSREITGDELMTALLERLGVPDDHQVNMYGLTELSTQFLDAVLRKAARLSLSIEHQQEGQLPSQPRPLSPAPGAVQETLPPSQPGSLSPRRGESQRERFKTVPAWARTRVLDPETLAELPPGGVGVLCHTDLANRASVCTVLTEDLGVAVEGGFAMLGRVAGSQARGCSIAMDELLTATRGTTC
jgi:D-arabinose 1-dehydrogenase-like Zn-dependent alcohol dehydrogenase